MVALAARQLAQKSTRSRTREFAFASQVIKMIQRSVPMGDGQRMVALSVSHGNSASKELLRCCSHTNCISIQLGILIPHTLTYSTMCATCRTMVTWPSATRKLFGWTGQSLADICWRGQMERIWVDYSSRLAKTRRASS